MLTLPAKRILFIILSGMSALVVNCQLASDLFISEYCEYNHLVLPSYYNHYIEIYNGTGETVDMSKYQLWRSKDAKGWNNDNGIPVEPLGLRGELLNNSVYVVGRPDTETNPISISADTSQSWSFMNISGDDAIGLARDNGSGTFVLTDLIGSETTDPGNGWSVAGVANATQNHTLVRKSSVTMPSTNWAASAGTNAANSEWIVLGENDISNLGKHNTGEIITPAEADTLIALFIGNSYIYYNDLPGLVNNIARSNNGFLIHDQNTPGSTSLEYHSSDPTTLSKLRAKAYDYVVLQDQSQRPAKSIGYVEARSFPFARLLDSIVREQSPCGRSVFYMTWGRKNGDAGNCIPYPDMCSYEGMDSLLNLRYRMMQEQNDALISPVGALWHYIRDTHPEIELYDADESHPSPAGSFAAACSFYTVFFRENPTKTSYNYSLTAGVANIIREAAKLVVYDSLYAWNNYYDRCNDIVLNILHPSVKDSFELSEFFTVEASASCVNSSIKQVEFYLNGVLMETDTLAPYNISLASGVEGKNRITVTATSETDSVKTRYVEFMVRSASLRVKELRFPGGVNIYPNPAHHEFFVELQNTPGETLLKLFNNVGLLLKEIPLNNQLNTIPVDDIPPGIYYIQLSSPGSIVMKKFIRD